MGAVVKINLSAIKHNAKVIKQHSNEKICAVLKCNAYGHGAKQVAAVADEYCDMFAVSNMYEAQELLSLDNHKKPILVMGVADTIINSQRITYTATSFDDVLKIASADNPKIHLKIDSGMNRLGIKDKAELQKIVGYIKKNPRLHLTGVFTHFAAAENPELRLQQKQAFDQAVNYIKRYFPRVTVHSSNSAAYLSGNKGMIRTGVMLYGYYPDGVAGNLNLQPSLEFVTSIAQIKRVSQNQGISYGHTYIADKDKTVAIINVGYGDGYPRSLSANGSVIIRNTRCKILGRVCMDLTVVDVSHIIDIQKSDEVTLIGKGMFADEVAKDAGTIVYEILTGITSRPKRLYITE